MFVVIWVEYEFDGVDEEMFIKLGMVIEGKKRLMVIVNFVLFNEIENG